MVHFKIMVNYNKLYRIRIEALEKAERNNDYAEKIRVLEEQTAYQPFEHDNTPDILKKLRSAHKEYTIEYLNNLYFETLSKIKKSDHENNISELLINCQTSFGCIEPLIWHNYKYYNSFDIKKIPAIYKGLIYFSVNGITDQLNNIADIVGFFDELKFHKSDVEKAFERRKLSSKIYNLIKIKGSFQQSKLKKELDFDNARFISSTVGYMVKADKLYKYKIGKTTFLKIK